MTYTPSTEEVRIKYRLVSGVGAVDAHDEFDRWLAEHTRQAKEEAWEEGFDAGEQDVYEHTTFDEPCKPNPYRSQP